MFRPGNPQEPVQNLFQQGLNLKFQTALHTAIRFVKDLEASVGATVADIRNKERTKGKLDRALLPFRVAAAWSGGVRLGPEHCDDQAYAEFLQNIANMDVLLQTGDIDAPRPWLEAYAAGVCSPLELKFLRLRTE